LNIALILVLVFALWRVVVPFDGDCGPAVYEAIHRTGVASNLFVRGPRYPCSSPARRRLTVAGVSSAVLVLGLLAVRSQFPSERSE